MSMMSRRKERPSHEAPAVAPEASLVLLNRLRAVEAQLEKTTADLAAGVAALAAM